jgi:hypothetical protein
MNKGIKPATGDFAIFMNAGDEFYDDDVCLKIFKDIFDYVVDVVYGDVIAVDLDSDMELIVKAKPLNDIFKGMIFSHQAVFIRLTALKKYPFNLEYKIVADYD